LGIAGTTAVAGKELCFAEEHRTKREREREREREMDKTRISQPVSK
jgi:hypothetical protein